jgi:citrate lyase subunit beta/citryl-CoA lyase
MRLRSLLFVPGDRPERMEKALDLGADALILDLEDSVAPANKAAARGMVADFLGRADRRCALFVRINPAGSADSDEDLDAVLSAAPDGIVLPKAEGARSIADLRHRLRGRHVPILPIATETPAAVFRLGDYAPVAEHRAGITWGAEDLPAAIGAAASRDDAGAYLPPYQVARALTLFGAAAAGVQPIETVYPNFRDLDGLKRVAEAAARDGFTGMMAIHPMQIPVINAAFTPSAEAVAHARAVVAAFDANPHAGALQLDGRMIDAPHLKQARRILERANP